MGTSRALCENANGFWPSDFVQESLVFSSPLLLLQTVEGALGLVLPYLLAEHKRSIISYQVLSDKIIQLVKNDKVTITPQRQLVPISIMAIMESGLVNTPGKGWKRRREMEGRGKKQEREADNSL